MSNSKNYFKEIARIIKKNRATADIILIINKEGIIEYTETASNQNWKQVFLFNQLITGKNVLEVYKDSLTKSNSTVMRAFKTKEIVSIKNQILKSSGYTFLIDAKSYPVLGSDGEVECVVDVTTLTHLNNSNDEEEEKINSILDHIITENTEMMKIKNNLPYIAQNDSSIFIYGDTGTGKELIAQAIHDLSERKDRPFISQNCAAIPEGLMESIFFGTEKGGFTGAEEKRGLFEIANGGDLFLDEINSMDVGMQSKLLKALEEQKVRKIGGETDINFDVRVICASNEEPTMLLREKRLRLDFFYRICVVRIDIPPLSKRPEDILLLSQHFIKMYNQKTGRAIRGISLLAQDLLKQWIWPGNVRELKGIIESAFSFEKSDTITLSSIMDVMKRMQEMENSCNGDVENIGVNNEKTECKRFESIKTQLETGTVDLMTLMEAYERKIIKEALKYSDKQSVVADKLSISPQSLNYKINKLKL